LGLLNLFEAEPVNHNLGIDPDAFKSIADIVFEQGLNFEEEMVVTEDGYHLTVMHVWHTSRKGQPVFFQHGLLSSADTWMMNKENSPAFIAARAGYDVWLGNNRGCKYSRGHDKLDPDTDSKEFFDFSFFELGKYDAPA
jgi:lysosomal acid lipase/cholesteryl ester hydrolase